MTAPTTPTPVDSLIEEGIPLPEAARKAGRSLSPEYAAWRHLEVGQSVFMAGKSFSTVKIYQSSASMKSLRKAGQRWHVEAAEKNGLPGVRVWRKV